MDCQTHDDALTQELHENCHSWIRIASGSSGALNRGVEQIRRLKYDAIVFGDMYMGTCFIFFILETSVLFLLFDLYPSVHV